MKVIASLLMFLVCGSVFAAAPSISCTTSRTSGTAPLAVFRDCTASTDADTSYPTLDLIFTHTSGDANAGTWAYGSEVNAKKSFAVGPVAAFVYENSGTFTLRSCATDGTSTSCSSATITVTAADTTFATNTACVYNTTQGSNCTGTGIQSSDFDAAIATARGANGCGTGIQCDRILFKGDGDTYVASVVSTLTNVTGPVEIGGYYSSSLPVVTWTGAAGATGFLRVGGTSSDVRFRNIKFDGEGVAGQGLISFQNTAWTNVLIQGIQGYRMALFLAPDCGGTACSGFYAVENSFTSPAASFNGESIYWANADGVGAVLGNYLSMDVLAQQNIRMGGIVKMVISHNTVTGVQTTKAAIDIRGSATVQADHIVISGNDVDPGNGYAGIYLQNNTASDIGSQRIIVERNYIHGSSSDNAQGIEVNADRSDVRNNVIDASNATMLYGITLAGQKGGTAQQASNIRVYNNTIYTSRSTGTLTGILVDTDVLTGNELKNNLVNAPNLAATKVADWGAEVPTASSNTCNTDACTTGVTTGVTFADTAAGTILGFKPTGQTTAAGASLFPATSLYVGSYGEICKSKDGSNWDGGAQLHHTNEICQGGAR